MAGLVVLTSATMANLEPEEVPELVVFSKTDNSPEVRSWPVSPRRTRSRRRLGASITPVPSYGEHQPALISEPCAPDNLEDDAETPPVFRFLHKMVILAGCQMSRASILNLMVHSFGLDASSSIGQVRMFFTAMVAIDMVLTFLMLGSQDRMSLVLKSSRTGDACVKLHDGFILINFLYLGYPKSFDFHFCSALIFMSIIVHLLGGYIIKRYI